MRYTKSTTKMGHPVLPRNLIFKQLNINGQDR